MLSIKADGYAPDQTCAVKVPEGVAEVRADCALVALPRAGTVVGRVHEVDEKGTTLAAVTNASVVLKDSAGKEHTNKTEHDGSFRSTDVAAGKGELTVTADGFVTSVETIEVKQRETLTLEVLLHKRGKPQVSVGQKEIYIKQQIQFATDQATILPQVERSARRDRRRAPLEPAHPPRRDPGTHRRPAAPRSTTRA